ncbi:hypothetical protein [Lysinibacillus sp. NPDC047702]|uniref:hypothetical protein n=1 Tax=unclassified Lysinibacillus TaxID=2636778 RepID=UPI003CFDB96F
MSAEKKVSLGVVGVDSGQLLIIDPCYINSEWNMEGSPVAIEFWGKDQDELSQILKNQDYKVNDEETYKLIECNEVNAKEIFTYIQKIIKENDLFVRTLIKTDSSYDTVCKITSNSDKQGGQLNYSGDQEGLGVAFRSGFGDGIYEVIATIKDCGSWGERVSKVEIILIEDDELDD